MIDLKDVTYHGLRNGLRGQELVEQVLSTLARLKGQGVEATTLMPGWAQTFYWRENTRDYGFDEYGNRLSRRVWNTLRERHLIDDYEDEFERSGYGVQVFSDERHEEINAPFGTLLTLDGSRGRDVTAPQRICRKDVDELIRDLTPLHWRLSNIVIRTYDLDRSWQEDLIQEARLRVFLKLHQYQGRSAFGTWAWIASRTAMIDLTRVLLGYERPTDVEVRAFRYRKVPADVDWWLDFYAALRCVKDADLVLANAWGFEDSEIEGGNLRMRRLRARKRLSLLVEADLATSA